MRCSCGEHDLKGDGPYEACHFCGHPTNCRPVVVWESGRLYYAICHGCTFKVDFEWLSILVHDAPPELVARAYQYDMPQHLGQA